MFAGSLLKVYIPADNVFVDFPLKWIRYESYKATPQQRMEWSAERDVSGYLWRETVQNQPPKIEFETPYIKNADVEVISALLKKAYQDAAQRALTIQYYNMESDDYRTAKCYLPDISYTIYNVDTDRNIITYEPIRFAFIGY